MDSGDWDGFKFIDIRTARPLGLRAGEDEAIDERHSHSHEQRRGRDMDL